MFDIKQEKNEIVVTVKLQKRTLAKHPKTYVYARDALREVKKRFPDLHISEVPDNAQVASTVRSPHEVTWKFKIIEKEEKQSKIINKRPKRIFNQLDEIIKNSQELNSCEKELDMDLTSPAESAILEETVEKVQEPTE